jgi:hypothetical protein
MSRQPSGGIASGAPASRPRPRSRARSSAIATGSSVCRSPLASALERQSSPGRFSVPTSFRIRAIVNTGHQSSKILARHDRRLRCYPSKGYENQARWTSCRIEANSLCVQAIWMTRTQPTSSPGLRPGCHTEGRAVTHSRGEPDAGQPHVRFWCSEASCHSSG